MAAHHEDMPSISSGWPGWARRRRTPEADSTGSGAWVPGMGAYGCQTRRRSVSRRSAGTRLAAAGATAAAGRPGAAAALLPQPHRHLERAALEAELLPQLAFHEPPVGSLQEPGGEQDHVRRPDAGLSREQHLGLLAAAHRRRGGRDQG